MPANSETMLDCRLSQAQRTQQIMLEEGKRNIEGIENKSVPIQCAPQKMGSANKLFE